MQMLKPQYRMYLDETWHIHNKLRNVSSKLNKHEHEKLLVSDQNMVHHLMLCSTIKQTWWCFTDCSVRYAVYRWIFSDIKLKENVEEVGVSPDGYKIYEFNYKGGQVDGVELWLKM